MGYLIQVVSALLAFLFGALSFLLLQIVVSLNLADARGQLGSDAGVMVVVSTLALYLAWKVIGSLYGVVQGGLRRFEQGHLDRSTVQAVRDQRPFILYLRSFKTDDGVKLETAPRLGRNQFADPRVFFSSIISGYAANGRRRSMDEAIYDATGYQYPIVCIGDQVATVGATRLSTTDEDWKSVFVELAQKACAIVCVPFPSAGSMWEIEWIGANAATKTVFIVPDGRSVGDNSSYEKFWQQSQAAFGWLKKPPRYRNEGLMFTVPSQQSEPRIWTLRPSTMRSAMQSIGVRVLPSGRPLIIAAYWLGLGYLFVLLAKDTNPMDYMHKSIGFLVFTGTLAAVSTLAFLIGCLKFFWHFRTAETAGRISRA